MPGVQDKEMITVGELFAGIGGIGLGLEMTGGFEVKWQVERDKYALQVLEKHWPEVVRHNDVLTFPPDDSDKWNVDVICGGLIGTIIGLTIARIFNHFITLRLNIA